MKAEEGLVGVGRLLIHESSSICSIGFDGGMHVTVVDDKCINMMRIAQIREVNCF